MEEREAVERLKHRDIDGLEYLVRRHQVRAVRAAYLVTRDLGLAQDVVQDAFLKAYVRIGQFDVARPFAPWFMTSVLRDAVKAARKQSRHSSLEAAVAEAEDASALLADSGAGPEALWEASETAEEVQAALAALTPEQRAAVVARYYLGMGEAEMAATLSCTTSTVKWRLYSARRRLRALLSPPRHERPGQGSVRADPSGQTGGI